MTTQAFNFHRKEWVLAATLVLGFVLAELPANIKDYTRTDARYSLENYGTGLASDASSAREHPAGCERC